jgi:hypothetical protein
MKLSENSIRKWARDKPCQVQKHGICSRDPAKSVMAHATILPPTGIMGGKTDSDILATYVACSNCHDYMDGRTHWSVSKEEKLFYEYRAVVRTWRMILKEITNAKD